MIELLDDADRFAARADGLIGSRAENTVLGTVLRDLRTGPRTGSAPIFALVLAPDGERVSAAALRTPPMPLVCSALAFDEDPGALMRAWLERDPELDGVNADRSTARALRAAWERLTGGGGTRTMDEVLLALEPGDLRDPPPPARGRFAEWPADLQALAIGWEQSASREMGMARGPEEAARAAGRRLREHRQHAWIVDGRPVCLVAHHLPVAGIPRIGPVYTPPEHRGHGYASSAVSALSLDLLAAGARRIVLFADRSNQTSNGIYARLGYRPLADFEQYRLTR